MFGYLVVQVHEPYISPHIKTCFSGTSLAVQWLRLRTPYTGGMGLIPGQGTKILHAAWCGQKKKKKEKTTDLLF